MSAHEMSAEQAIEDQPMIGDGFDEKIVLKLFEEISPEEATRQGGFKTKDDESEVGGLVHYSGKNSGYTVTVRRLLAIDGWEDESVEDAKRQRMTLLVLDYKASSSSEDGRYSSIRTWLDFDDLDKTEKKDRALPKVVAWAPFVTTERWNETEGDVRVKKGAGLEAGVANIGEAKAHVDIEKEVEHKMRFFDKGHTEMRLTSPPHPRCNGVRWILTQNKGLDLGVPPELRIAVLIKRYSDAPLKRTFGFRCAAGPWQSIKDGVIGMFGCGLNVEKERVYTPQNEPRLWADDDQDCKDILDEIDKPEIGRNNLGRLQEGDRLAGLTKVWGLEPFEKTESKKKKIK